MKMRYLGLFALAPLLNQCQPACAPTPAPVETTTTVAEVTTSTAAAEVTTTTAAPTTTQATTTTTAPQADYTLDLSCTPLQGTFTAGARDIVVQGGFGGGGTPQTLIPAGTSQTLPWISFMGEVYNPVPEITFGVVDVASGATIDEQMLVLADECPGGWTSPGAPTVIPRPGCGGDIGGVFSPPVLWITLGRTAPADGWTIHQDGVFYGTWADATNLDTPDDADVGWPFDPVPDSMARIFHDSFTVDVYDASGTNIYHDTFSKARLAAEGATNCLRLFG